VPSHQIKEYYLDLGLLSGLPDCPRLESSRIRNGICMGISFQEYGEGLVMNREIQQALCPGRESYPRQRHQQQSHNTPMEAQGGEEV
jgi:hypothetical protein